MLLLELFLYRRRKKDWRNLRIEQCRQPRYKLSGWTGPLSAEQGDTLVSRQGSLPMADWPVPASSQQVNHVSTATAQRVTVAFLLKKTNHTQSLQHIW